MTKTVTLGGLKCADFERKLEGQDNSSVGLFILSNGNGMEMAVTNYGAKIVSLHVPDRAGKLTDVVLGHNNLDEYLTSQEPYFGAICGRVANRIAKGRFTLEGKTYQLAVNNGPNHLHGGIKGFNARIWKCIEQDDNKVVLIYLSNDGEEGYPGAIATRVTYELTDNNEVIISYFSAVITTTLVNLTNHSYFNLSGAGDPYIGDHILTINADRYLPTDETNIPLGPLEPVEGTPFDFRSPHTIGERINDDFEQLRIGRGYDHCYVINNVKEGKMTLCATAVSPKTGIAMDVLTDQPGVQLYTGNWMTGEFVAKNGQRYPSRSAFCLETQHFPDSINHPEYPTIVIDQSKEFESKTLFKFYIK